MTKHSAEEVQHMISEIAQGFSSIDEKVMDLNEVSNQDFSALNKTFKRHYETTKIISDSSSDILSKINDFAGNEVFKKIKLVISSGHAFLEDIQSNVDRLYTEVAHLETDFKHIFIPILNFKQNISTLRFLLTNLKLNHGLIDGNAKVGTELLIENLNVKIADIQSEIPAIAEDIEQLKILYAHVSKGVKRMIDDVIPQMGVHNTELMKNMQEINTSLLKAVSVKNIVSQKAQQGFQNLNQVITNLQYHDIIRQKIEHIQITHKNILQELTSLEKGENAIQKGLDYLKQIPGITEIQAGQLLLTNKEYQSAIENSSNKLIETSKTLAEVNDITRSIFGEVNVPEFARVLIEGMQAFYKISETLFHDINSLESKNMQLQKHIKLQVNHYDKLTLLETEISYIIKEINENTVHNNEIKAIATKLITLLSGINESKGNIGRILAVHKNNTLSLLVENLQKAANFIQTKNIDHAMLNVFSETLNSIDNQIVSNGKEYKQLDDQLKKTLENIRYYEFYDDVVEQIISQLNFIYRKILPVSDKEDVPGDLLTAMKSAYTMKSQRDIHDQNDLDEKNSGDGDDNLELF